MVSFLRSSTTVVLVLLITLLQASCDSVEESLFAAEVLKIDTMKTSFGAPSFHITIRNAGSEALSRAAVEITVYPQQQLRSGVSVERLEPGGAVTAEVVLLHVDRHSDYSCYTSRLMAFAPGEESAVVDRAGPRTCR